MFVLKSMLRVDASGNLEKSTAAEAARTLIKPLARLSQRAEREPLAKKATIGQVFDLTIARKLDKEGFFKTVFKR